MNLWQIVLIALLFALWVWALVAFLIDLFRRTDLSGGVRIAWVVLVILLPVLGVGAYVVARPRLTERERRSVATYDAVVDPDAEAKAAQIADLARLRAEGAITDAEFEKRRRRLL